MQLKKSLKISLFISTLIMLMIVFSAPLKAQLYKDPSVEIRSISINNLRAKTVDNNTITLPIRANIIGASWVGDTKHIYIRSKVNNGKWSNWAVLTSDNEGPNPLSKEASKFAKNTNFANPVYVAQADQIQLKNPNNTVIKNFKIDAINSEGTANTKSRAISLIKTKADNFIPEAAAIALKPMINLRESWGAVRPKVAPEIVDKTVGVVVHHTVSTNSYSCKSVPSMLRGIQAYHMRSNGWNDIGYNFVIDRCGGIWEARQGGILSAVVGAHTAGFNTNTVGIAMLGTYASARPSQAAQRSLQKLIAWRLDNDHILPSGYMKVTARSSDKFKKGSVVTAKAVSGHRDLYPTACPGGGEYKLLKNTAIVSTKMGGLKVANITTTPKLDNNGNLISLSVRAIATDKTAATRIAVERISTTEVIKDSLSTGTVSTLTTAAFKEKIPAWDIRVRVNSATKTQRARGYLKPLIYYPESPGFLVIIPPQSSVVLDQYTIQSALLSLEYSLEKPAKIEAWLYDQGSAEDPIQLKTSTIKNSTSTTKNVLQIEIPATVQTGSYELKVGVFSDKAPGRSIISYPLNVTTQ